MDMSFVIYKDGDDYFCREITVPIPYCLLSKIQTLPILNVLKVRERERENGGCTTYLRYWLNTLICQYSVGLCLKRNNSSCVPYSAVCARCPPVIS